ncbi:ferritin [Opitutaceae bacterium TAV4]|nr:ferritin [Opitutaceae bacterium TAV4]RRK01264.1 ferritin [Opitutaceae bacterium TAV3]
MTPTLATALNQQANREHYTSLMFLALKYWAEAEQHAGFAKFFAIQAEEEESHAKKFYQHLTDRGATPVIGPVASPPATYPDLLTVAQALYDHERENTRCIHAVYEAALAEKDYAAQVFLHEFITEQVEEEAWTDRLLERTRRATCCGGLFNLDHHLVKDLLGDKAA